MDPGIALRFRCTSCAECCRKLRVAITHHDLRRLIDATSRAPQELVAWLSPNEVDMTGEPESFVELAGGRALMALAQHEAACLHLEEAGSCAVYAHRPLDCR